MVLNSLRTLAWNPTGQLIATGSADRTLRIWNPERPAIKYSTELRGHSAAVEKVLFNPIRDAELASCSADGTVRFWDVRSKTCVSRLDVGGEAFTLSWSADGSTMVVGRKVSHEGFPSISLPVLWLTLCPSGLGRHFDPHLGSVPVYPYHPITRRCYKWHILYRGLKT